MLRKECGEWVTSREGTRGAMSAVRQVSLRVPLELPAGGFARVGIRETTEQFEAPPFTGNVPARWMLVGK